MAKRQPGVYPTSLIDAFSKKSFLKHARLILLRKANRPLEVPNSHRPLCILDLTGKFLEKLLDTILKTICKANKLLTENQYGFRRGKLILDALNHVMRTVNEGTLARRIVGILLLDVKNVFNSAPCRVNAESLQSKGVSGYICRILDDYFDEMALHYDV